MNQPPPSSTAGTALHVTKLIEALPENEPYYTFEVFPPKTTPGMTNLLSRLARMSALQPTWFHVTWGAGGSTQEKSVQLVGEAQSLVGRPGCLHLTCTNMEVEVLVRTLERAKELGVSNVLALRGDPPRGEEYWVSTNEQFQHATDLVKFIKEKYGDTFCIGVAGYPEGHADSVDKLADVEYLFQKQEAGADFVVTQLFYDVEVFMTWYNACRARGITIPILPGIMPIQNYQSFRRMTNLCKSSIPAHIIADLERIENDDAAVKDYGVDLAVSMIEKLRKEGIRGYHLCTLNLEKSVTRVLEKLGWVPQDEPHTFKGDELMVLNGATKHLRVPLSSPSAPEGARQPASWDEFPNGRFGDARSPAYGDLDGYGTGLKLSPSEALLQWGHPTCLSDISTLFSSYLSGTLPSIPWSEEPLRGETSSISSSLIRLNDERHWWTVGSQPAVDGIASSHPVYGFGPKGGYVYQKAFVEFFLDEAELEMFEKRAQEEERIRKEKGEGEEGLIKWFAGKRESEVIRSNVGKGDVNAVTWGVFGGKEIVTTTMIEEMSFKAWKGQQLTSNFLYDTSLNPQEEAFSIWLEWSHLYPINSPSRKFLKNLADTRWLVSVVHHDYKDEMGLWKWLLEQPKMENPSPP